MSAPTTAYYSIALKDKTTPQNYLTCKYLSEYTNIGSHFYLDKVLKCKDSSIDYFIGACVVGSVKASYHASGRKGRLFQGLELYTDGGLNTLAHIEFRNSNEPKWVNWVNLAYYLLSAYYNDTTSFGYSYKINSGSWVNVSVSSLAQKLDKEDKITHIDLTPSADESDTLTFKMWAINAEGTKYSAEYSFTALETLAIPTGANKYSTINGITTGTATLYMLSTTESALDDVSLSDGNTGLYLYKSEYFNTTTPSTGDIVDDGYYVIGGVPAISTTQEKAFYVVSGQIRKYEIRTIVIPAIRLRLVDTGSPGLIVPKVLVSIVNNDGNGFRNTVTINCDIEYYNDSGVYQTKATKSINLVDGDTQAYSGLTALPPSGYGIKKVKIVSTSSEATLGMALEVPLLTALPFYYDD